MPPLARQPILPRHTATDSAHTEHGLVWLDGNFKIKGLNHTYRQLLDLGDESSTYIGRPFPELLDLLSMRGEFSGAPVEITLAQQLQQDHPQGPFKLERQRPNGTTLSVALIPQLPDGYIYIYRDISVQRRLQDALRRSNKTAVVSMANMAEHRDSDTGIHVLRVARLVSQTARKLMLAKTFGAQIDEEFIDLASTASVLHDLGKISTPDQILLKTGKLTDAERLTMQNHTIIGANLIQQAKRSMGSNPYLDLGAEIALTHHEWFNGAGYPNKLAGQDIPLAGRICAVADVFDALTSNRPYKTAWSNDQAIEFLVKAKGVQFDPKIVDAFLQVMDERLHVCVIPWSPQFCVGHPHLDEQHRILLDTINQLASADSLNNHYAVAMIIDELHAYAAFHFDTEEKVIADINFPALEEHRREHQEFVQWIDNFRDDYVSSGKKPLGAPVLAFLKQWLSDHILQSDQNYRPYLPPATYRP